MFANLFFGLGILGLFCYFSLFPKIKLARSEHLKKLKDQLLRLFVPGEKLTGLRLCMRLEERTGGRGIPLVLIYLPLKELVAEGKLVSEVSKIVKNGEELIKVEYYLPE